MNALLLLVALAPAQPTPLDKAWYSPHELLPALAARDGIRWALPEALAGRAWVDGDGTYKVLLDDLRVGQRWQFRLTANPVRSVRLPGWEDAKPVGHVTVRQQLDWLTERAERLGFRLAPSSVGTGDELDVAVVDRSIKQFARQKRQVTISTATFEGHLEVVDPAALRHALTHGIGRAKAYGCGMLTLAPAVGARG